MPDLPRPHRTQRAGGFSAITVRCTDGRPLAAGLGTGKTGPGSVSTGRPATADGSTAVLGLTAGLPVADLLGLAARCDSALIWVMVLGRLRAGAGLAEALTGTLGDLAVSGVTGRFNLLLTDGASIAATAAGDSLCYRQTATGVTVASEPCDDDGWQDIPDDSVLEATPESVIVRPLTVESGACREPASAPTAVPNGERTSP